MSEIKVEFNESAFDLEVDIEPVLKLAAKNALKSMANNPKIPHERVNYAGSFYIEKENNPDEMVYVVKNHESWMDAFINNGHIIWNSDNGTRIDGTFHYETAQEIADKIVLGSKVELKNK